MRYEVVRSSKYFGYLVWDTLNETFLKKPSGAILMFEDDTQARIYIDQISDKG